MNTGENTKLLCAIYVHHFHLERLQKLGLQEGNGSCSSEQYLHINLDDIPECFSALKKQMQTNPVRAKAILETGVGVVQNFLIKRQPNYTKHPVRVYFSASSNQPLSSLNQCRAEGHLASLVGKLIVVQARVIRMMNPRLIQKRSEYKCRECGHVFLQEAEFEQYYAIALPKMCPSSKACGSKLFEELIAEDQDFLKRCSRSQECSIVDIDLSGCNYIPKRMSVALEEDLVERCQIGDIVRISGTLRQRWSPLIKNQQPRIELVLHATWISTVNDLSTKDLSPDYAQKLEAKFNDFWRHYADDPIRGRDTILTVVCSDLYQLFLAKLALMLCLIGGVTDISSTGTTVRGDPHLLFIGDAGTGKSCLLKFATRIAKRSVYSTGVGTSSAGLTCSVSKIDGQWHAEPGALPLSNGGVCCIDEFHTLTESDRAALREAMETQRLSIAKAGVKTVLPCRCAVISAMNRESITRVGDAPLYSRFDLILNLSSSASNELIINHNMKIAKYIAAKLCSTDSSVRTSAKSAPKSFWSVQTLRVYVARVKKLKPLMTPGAENVLSQYYALQRRNAARDDGKTTNRLRDALIRLSQAHARLMYRQTVEICDAIVACILADSSSPGMELFETIDVLHSRFPLESKKDFITKGTEVLIKLNLSNLISEIIPPYQDLASTLESSSRSSIHVELTSADNLNEKSSVAEESKGDDILIEKDLLELINSDSTLLDEESPNEYGKSHDRESSVYQKLKKFTSDS